MQGGGMICACCTAVLFLTSVILFAVSFDTIDVTQVGLRYNRIRKRIEEDKYYNNGRHFLGLGQSFITFPTTFVPIDFMEASALRCWSKEGQLVEIDVGFYYRLNRTRVSDIYSKYGKDYHNRLTQIAVRSIKAVTIQYEATEFFEVRQNIGTHMLMQLRESFRNEYVTVELFALREISIPNNFEAKVVQKVVEAQARYTEEWIRDSVLAQANITVLQGQGEASVNLITANANAAATIVVAKAEADGLKLVSEQQAATFSELATTLELAPQDLLKYRFAKIKGEMQHAHETSLSLILGFDNPVLQVK